MHIVERCNNIHDEALIHVYWPWSLKNKAVAQLMFVVISTSFNHPPKLTFKACAAGFFMTTSSVMSWQLLVLASFLY